VLRSCLYVTFHDQLAGTVQRLSARLGSTFVNGGIHSHFGARTFTLRYKMYYREAVYLFDNPSTDKKVIAKII
jgi:hypothetical protein